jgi:hypothetical protein
MREVLAQQAGNLVARSAQVEIDLFCLSHHRE